MTIFSLMRLSKLKPFFCWDELFFRSVKHTNIFLLRTKGGFYDFMPCLSSLKNKENCCGGGERTKIFNFNFCLITYEKIQKYVSMHILVEKNIRY